MVDTSMTKIERKRLPPPPCVSPIWPKLRAAGENLLKVVTASGANPRMDCPAAGPKRAKNDGMERHYAKIDLPVSKIRATWNLVRLCGHGVHADAHRVREWRAIIVSI